MIKPLPNNFLGLTTPFIKPMIKKGIIYIDIRETQIGLAKFIFKLN